MHRLPLYLLTVIIILSSCQEFKKSNKRIAPVKENSNRDAITSKEYSTQSGKVFIVHIDHSMGESICDVQIETKGFTATNAVHKLGTIDPVKEVFLADLDKNGFEEIYLITQSAGSGSYGKIYGIASNKDKSATPIYFREIVAEQKTKGALFEGYLGHDSFLLENGKITNSFPIYKENDTNNNPTGGKSKIQYSLVAGEAGWILEPDKY